VVPQRAAGDLLDLVHPVDDRVAVDVQGRSSPTAPSPSPARHARITLGPVTGHRQEVLAPFRFDGSITAQGLS
jgi:hypothetical protein